MRNVSPAAARTLLSHPGGLRNPQTWWPTVDLCRRAGPWRGCQPEHLSWACPGNPCGCWCQFPHLENGLPPAAVRAGRAWPGAQLQVVGSAATVWEAARPPARRQAGLLRVQFNVIVSSVTKSEWKNKDINTLARGAAGLCMGPAEGAWAPLSGRGDACSPGPGQAELGLGEAEKRAQSPE